MISRLISLRKLIRPQALSVSLQPCAICRWRFQIKLCHDEMGVRCTACGASAVTQSLVQVLRPHLETHRQLKIYELSARGALVRFLQSTPHEITMSEYFDDVPAGTCQDGVMCQDVQRLTYADESFDLCTSLEVFEHVEDDMRGFREIYRVLRPGGKIIFTVPINLSGKTVERTKWVDGKRVNTLPPEYHTDRLRGTGKVFCFRNYGLDIVNRLEEAGFSRCRIIPSDPKTLFGLGRAVIIGQK